ncbi:MAG: hypothetical protein ACRDT5_15075 [Mycobacterium sp.]
MDKSAKVVTRGWVPKLIGTVLLAGALVALCFPVYLSTYDQYGMEINCGNGYYSRLLQAATDDQNQAHRSAPAAGQPATNYVDQCKSALLHRRAWTVSVAAVGVLILIPELVAWTRRGSATSSATTGTWSATHVDEDMEEAALLDRRELRHRPRPDGTTL